MDSLAKLQQDLIEFQTQNITQARFINSALETMLKALETVVDSQNEIIKKLS